LAIFVRFSFHIAPAPISYLNTLTSLYFILASPNLFQSSLKSPQLSAMIATHLIRCNNTQLATLLSWVEL